MTEQNDSEDQRNTAVHAELEKQVHQIVIGTLFKIDNL